MTIEDEVGVECDDEGDLPLDDEIDVVLEAKVEVLCVDEAGVELDDWAGVALEVDDCVEVGGEVVGCELDGVDALTEDETDTGEYPGGAPGDELWLVDDGVCVLDDGTSAEEGAGVFDDAANGVEDDAGGLEARERVAEDVVGKLDAGPAASEGDVTEEVVGVSRIELEAFE